MDAERDARAKSTSQPVSKVILIEREHRAKLEKAYFYFKNLYKKQLLEDEIDNNEFIIKNKILNRTIDEKMRDLTAKLHDLTTPEERRYAAGYGLYNGVDRIKMSKPFNILNPDQFEEKENDNYSADYDNDYDNDYNNDYNNNPDDDTIYYYDYQNDQDDDFDYDYVEDIDYTFEDDFENYDFDSE